MLWWGGFALADGVVALIWTIGIYAIAFGALLFSLGLRLLGHGERRLSRA